MADKTNSSKYPSQNTRTTMRLDRNAIKNSIEAPQNLDSEHSITFKELSTKYRYMAFEDFVKDYPDPCLLQRSGVSEDGSSGFKTDITKVKEPEQLLELNQALLIFIKKHKPLFPNMITVGRTKNNDLYLGNPRLSKFHAYFQKQGEQWVLVDAGSTNGTRIEQVELEAHREYTLSPENAICFAFELHFRFLDAKTLFGLLRSGHYTK